MKYIYPFVNSPDYSCSIEIVVSFVDFERSLEQFVPSVKPEEFQKYEAIRNHMLRT